MREQQCTRHVSQCDCLKVGWLTQTHTPFYRPFFRGYPGSRYQKGKTNLDFTEARDREWQWHQVVHMQVCTLLQTDNHANTPPLCFYRPVPFLPPNQQHQSTEGTSWLVNQSIRLIKLAASRVPDPSHFILLYLF